jgi:fatty acid desaturase
MITAFWILFLCACAIVLAALFMWLLIPIIVIGLLVLALSHCGGSNGRSMVEGTNSHSAKHSHRSSRNSGQI